MRAEHGTYNDATGEVEATGRVVFDGGPHDAHLIAAHATYNVKSETGMFLRRFRHLWRRGARADRGAHHQQSVRHRRTRGAQGGPQPLHRLPRQHHLLRRAGPDLDLQRGEDRPGGGRGRQALSLQLPPAEAADLLLSLQSSCRPPKWPAPADSCCPTIGQSSTKGFILGESVYWAINRSSDLTVGARVLLLARLEPDGAVPHEARGKQLAGTALLRRDGSRRSGDPIRTRAARKRA